jgi:DNA-binding response OmpR family regulator
MARILVVEDDRSQLEIVRLHLEAREHSVVCAADTIEGIKALLAEDFELILTDIGLPYLSGLEFLRAVRGDSKTSQIPMVILTGKTDDETWAEATLSGADGYLTKPVKKEELAAVIDKALAGGGKRPRKAPLQLVA